MARPLGSENKDKPYREALRMELAAAGDNLSELREVAKKHIALAKRGDMAAIKEMADRLDGKPSQAVEQSGEVVHRYVIEVPADITSEEWEKRYGSPIQTTVQ